MDKIKKAAARRFVLPVEQIRYYSELNQAQRETAARHWGKIPPYSNYIYAIKTSGGLVWDRFSALSFCG